MSWKNNHELITVSRQLIALDKMIRMFVPEQAWEKYGQGLVKEFLAARDRQTEILVQMEKDEYN